MSLKDIDRSRVSNRRTYLKGVGALGTVGLAGCLGGDDEDDDPDDTGNGDSVGDSEEPEFEFTVADHLPPEHPARVNSIILWADKVREYTDGRVDFEFFSGGELGGATDMPELLETGAADVAYLGPAYISDLMPLSAVGELPFQYPDSVVATEAYWQLAQPGGLIYEHELEPMGAFPVGVNLLPPYQIMTRDEPIETLEDWEGKTIRTAGGAQSISVELLGGSAVEMPAPEIYETIERGTADGTILAFTSVPGYDLEEVLDYSTTNLSLASFTTVYSMDLELYESLPSDIQDAIFQATEEVVTEGAQNLEGVANDVITDRMEPAGVEMYEVDEDEMTEWYEMIDPARNQWADEREEQGFPGHDVVDQFISAIEDAQ